MGFGSFVVVILDVFHLLWFFTFLPILMPAHKLRHDSPYGKNLLTFFSAPAGRACRHGMHRLADSQSGTGHDPLSR